MDTIAQLLSKIKQLTKENNALHQQLIAAGKTAFALKGESIDALVVAHKRAVKIYTEPSADKIYRILIERMQEGAVTLNKEGMILYCNSYFANKVGLPLEKVIGEKLEDFVSDASQNIFQVLFEQGWQDYAQDEVYLHTNEAEIIPVLMSANTLFLENTFVLSIVLTDLTLQKKRVEFKTTLIENIMNAVIEMNNSEERISINNSEYISNKLNYDYNYLSNIFSEVKGITIGQFIIANKIEKVKQLLLHGELNLTEISYTLQYSSVAHLSHQFKQITGFSPTRYVKMKGTKDL